MLLLAAACGGSSDDANKDDGAATPTTKAKTTTSTKPVEKSTTASSTQPDTTDTDPSSSSSTTSGPTTSTAVPATTRPNETMSSDQWVLQSLDTLADAAGNWAGTAAILNEKPDARDGDFVLTLKRGSATVATLTGTAVGVEGGTTAKVSLASTDGYTPGEYTVDFKATFGF